MKLPLGEGRLTIKEVDSLCSVATQCHVSPTAHAQTSESPDGGGGVGDADAMVGVSTDAMVGVSTDAMVGVSTRREAQHQFISEFVSMIDAMPGYGTAGVRTVLATLERCFGRKGSHSFESANYALLTQNLPSEHICLDSTVSVLNYLRNVFLVEEVAFVDLMRQKVRHANVNWRSDLEKAIGRLDTRLGKDFVPAKIGDVKT